MQGNPEGFVEHVLIRHGCDRLLDAPRDFAGLKEYLSEHDIEGVVWLSSSPPSLHGFAYFSGISKVSSSE